MRFRSLAFILILSLCIGLTAPAVLASSDAPPALGSEAASGSRALEFQRAIVKVPFGTAVGTYYDGLLRLPRADLRWGLEVGVAPEELNATADSILQFHQNATSDGPASLFDDKEPAKSVLLLGAIITNLRFDAYGPMAGNRSAASLTVEWQLYDPIRKRLVFTAKTDGRMEERGITMSPILGAFSEALDALLIDSRFKSAVSSPAEAESVQAGTADKIVIRTNPAGGPSALPDNLDRATAATVMIRVGNTIGAGAIVSRDGYVLTARHVVAGIREVMVTLKSGVTLPAQVVRTDPVQDLALLKLSGTGFTAFPVELKARESVGSEIYAIGTPASEELSFSVTRGIVSGYRELDGCWYLQTDASVSPGYSGGPMISQQGKLVGITSWKIVEQGFEGLSFGIPLDVAADSLGITWE